jgi:hypothetical protein
MASLPACPEALADLAVGLMLCHEALSLTARRSAGGARSGDPHTAETWPRDVPPTRSDVLEDATSYHAANPNREDFSATEGDKRRGGDSNPR